nr:coat protein [Leviviridae sp.]
MATPSTSFGYTDSVTTEKSVSIPDLSYLTDFAVKDESATALVLTNTTSPVDQPELVRWGYQNIADIYAGTGIDPSFMAVSRRGVSLVGQVNDILRITPAEESGCCTMQQILLPIEAHWVLKFPVSQYVTPEIARQVLNRAYSTSFGTGEVGSKRLGAMMRGSLSV